LSFKKFISPQIPEEKNLAHTCKDEVHYQDASRE